MAVPNPSPSPSNAAPEPLDDAQQNDKDVARSALLGGAIFGPTRLDRFVNKNLYRLVSDPTENKVENVQEAGIKALQKKRRQTAPSPSNQGMSKKEGDRLSRLRASQNAVIADAPGGLGAGFGNNNETNETSESETSSGPSMGEEGYAEIGTSYRTQPSNESDTEDENFSSDLGSIEGEREAAFQADTNALREAATEDDDTDESGDETDDDTPADEDETIAATRSAVDNAMNDICYGLPVLGHVLWFNVKMIFGSWISKGEHPAIGPLTFDDLMLAINPTSGLMKGASKAGSALLPNSAMELALIVTDMVLLISEILSIAIPIVIFFLPVLAPSIGLTLAWSFLTSAFTSAPVK